MRKKISVFLSALAAVLLPVSCQRNPIEYPVSNYYIAIETAWAEEESSNEIYSVNFYSTTSGRLELKTYIHPDSHPANLPRGGYIQGIVPGDYMLVVYKYDTKSSKVRNYENVSKIYANTETFNYNKSVPINYMPDHLYTDLQEIEIPYLTANDDLYIIESRVETVLETWKVIIHGVKNIEKTVEANIYVSGQAPGRWLGPADDVIDGNSIIAYSVDVHKTGAVAPDGETLISHYTTFGRNIDGERSLLTLYITGPGGTVTWGQADVTQQIIDGLESGNYVIEVSFDMEVTDRRQGGFDPTAKEWIPDLTEIVL